MSVTSPPILIYHQLLQLEVRHRPSEFQLGKLSPGQTSIKNNITKQMSQPNVDKCPTSHFHRVTDVLVSFLQLEKGDYPENAHVVSVLSY